MSTCVSAVFSVGPGLILSLVFLLTAMIKDLVKIKPKKCVHPSVMAKLQGSGISNSLVSSIVGDLEELTSELHSQAKHTAISALPTSDPNMEAK